ncbi:hypothetical protein DVDV_2265 [Desulfovibrio sp. DV]|nr:hypothetical protein DVDV_2265 [Desulfovibrio sp. DV]
MWILDHFCRFLSVQLTILFLFVEVIVFLYLILDMVKIHLLFLVDG